jgi:hypothetical protein
MSERSTVGTLPPHLAPIISPQWRGELPLPWETYDPEDYLAPPKVFADGRTAWCIRMMCGARIAVSPSPQAIGMNVGEEWCYDATGEATAAEWRALAVLAFLRWDGSGEPDGWMQHPASGRYRDDGDPARERVGR